MLNLCLTVYISEVSFALLKSVSLGQKAIKKGFRVNTHNVLYIPGRSAEIR